MLWKALLVLSLFTGSVLAQQITLPEIGSYRAGVYTPVTIHAEEAGLISLRGPGALGIDWLAPGKASVTVPWMTWRVTPEPIALTLNGQPVRVTYTSTSLPQSNVLYEDSFSDIAYIPTYGCTPGRRAQARWQIVLAGGATILLLIAVRVGLSKSLWMAPSMLLVGVSIAILLPLNGGLSRRDSRITITVLDRQSGGSDRWIYRTSKSAERVAETWDENRQVRLIPKSPAELSQLDPILKLDPTGRPIEISANVSPGRFAVFFEGIPGSEIHSDPDSEISPELVRRVYGRDFSVVDGMMVLKPSE